jgi:hypothetical protein
MTSSYPPWPLYYGDWTTKDFQSRRFANESEFKAKLLEVGGENDGFECRASFRPQISTCGESPALTSPWLECRTKHWSEIESFLAKTTDWPYVYVCANVMCWTIEDGARIGNNFPIHIFYRRIQNIQNTNS